MQSHASAMRDVATAEVLGYVHTSIDITDSLQERAARERTHVQVRSLAHRLEHQRAQERAARADTLKKDFYEPSDGLRCCRPARGPRPRSRHGRAGCCWDRPKAQERRHRLDLRPPGIE
jgi:hypothetical protein